MRRHLVPAGRRRSTVASTLTAFVIDLVVNQTALDTSARPFVEFSTLPDLDQDNPAAYGSLF